MAKKANFLRQAQMIRAEIELGNRQPHPPAGALYLMKLRSHPIRISMTKQRLEIAVENDGQAQTPESVKIIHAG